MLHLLLPVVVGTGSAAGASPRLSDITSAKRQRLDGGRPRDRQHRLICRGPWRRLVVSLRDVDGSLL
jgi:hypothetical protein